MNFQKSLSKSDKKIPFLKMPYNLNHTLALIFFLGFLLRISAQNNTFEIGANILNYSEHALGKHTFVNKANLLHGAYFKIANNKHVLRANFGIVSLNSTEQLNFKYGTEDTSYAGFGHSMAIAFGLQNDMYTKEFFSLYWFGDAEFTFTQSEKNVFVNNGHVMKDKANYSIMGVIIGMGIEIVLIKKVALLAEGGLNIGIGYSENQSIDLRNGSITRSNNNTDGVMGIVPINMLGIGFKF